MKEKVNTYEHNVEINEFLPKQISFLNFLNLEQNNNWYEKILVKYARIHEMWLLNRN